MSDDVTRFVLVHYVPDIPVQPSSETMNRISTDSSSDVLYTKSETQTRLSNIRPWKIAVCRCRTASKFGRRVNGVAKRCGLNA